MAPWCATVGRPATDGIPQAASGSTLRPSARGSRPCCASYATRPTPRPKRLGRSARGRWRRTGVPFLPMRGIPHTHYRRRRRSREHEHPPRRLRRPLPPVPQDEAGRGPGVGQRGGHPVGRGTCSLDYDRGRQCGSRADVIQRTALPPGGHPLTRGRKRRFDPTIPGHIEQKKLPTGIYWNRRDRYWYTIAGKPAKRTRVAEGDALMSDLHKAMEAVRGVKTDTLEYLLAKFDASAHFRNLSQATRDGYTYSHNALKTHPTKLGIPFSELPMSAITLPLVQRLVDEIAETFPTKANAIKRYLSVAFSWGMRRGHCASNPAKGVAQAKEKRDHRMPETDKMQAFSPFLRRGGG